MGVKKVVAKIKEEVVKVEGKIKEEVWAVEKKFEHAPVVAAPKAETRCSECEGSGVTGNGTPCSYCNGKGKV